MNKIGQIADKVRSNVFIYYICNCRVYVKFRNHLFERGRCSHRKRYRFKALISF